MSATTTTIPEKYLVPLKPEAALPVQDYLNRYNACVTRVWEANNGRMTLFEPDTYFRRVGDRLYEAINMYPALGGDNRTWYVHEVSTHPLIGDVTLCKTLRDARQFLCDLETQVQS